MSGLFVHSVAQVGLAGLEHAREAAQALPPAPAAFRHMIDPACYETFKMHSALACTGRVKAHVDTDFPEWAGILVLRCGTAAVLKVGKEEVALAPGLAVTFNAHRRHSVQQERNEVLVWLPVYDGPEPIDAGTMLKRAIPQFRRRARAAA